jgi:hypothetical protein
MVTSTGMLNFFLLPKNANTNSLKDDYMMFIRGSLRITFSTRSSIDLIMGIDSR